MYGNIINCERLHSIKERKNGIIVLNNR